MAAKPSFIDRIFEPMWPPGLKLDAERFGHWEMVCDDKPRSSVFRLLSAPDGDFHLGMIEHQVGLGGEPVPDRLDPLPTLRIRTHAGGGRNWRTIQAIRWLALAMQLDAEEQGRNADGSSKRR